MTTDHTPYDPSTEAHPDWAGYQDDLTHRAVVEGARRSQEIADRLRRAAIEATAVRRVADLPRIPILDKDRLIEMQASDPPFGGMLGVPVEQLRRVYLSPGPILDPEGDEPDFWRMAPALWAAGFRAGHIVQNCFAYHLTPAGVMLDEGLRAVGCVVVPGGVGDTEWQVDVMMRAGVTGYVGTPAFLLTLLEKARHLGSPVGLRRAFVTGAPLPPPLRHTLQSEFSVEVYQGYGTADAGTLGYECGLRDGWHIAPSVVIEVTDPATGDPVSPGETGHVVVTSPNPVYPLVRFGTGDLSAIEVTPCSCGRTSPRLLGFRGRVGDGVKVRGMFVHPAQLTRALERFPGVARYQAVVSARGHQDDLTVRIEPHPETTVDREQVLATIRGAIKLRVDIDLVAPGTLDAEAPPLVDTRPA